jgi:hypothetical protein
VEPRYQLTTFDIIALPGGAFRDDRKTVLHPHFVGHLQPRDQTLLCVYKRLVLDKRMSKHYDLIHELFDVRA